jgi:hypothetical protein
VGAAYERPNGAPLFLGGFIRPGDERSKLRLRLTSKTRNTGGIVPPTNSTTATKAAKVSSLSRKVTILHLS